MQLTFTFEPTCSDCGTPLSIVVSRPDHPKFDSIRGVYSFQVVPCTCASKSGTQPPQATNSDYTAAVNDLHKLHSDVSLAGLPYGGSWLDRIEKIINHLNAAKSQHSA